MIRLFVSDLDGTLLLPKHPGLDERILNCLYRTVLHILILIALALTIIYTAKNRKK